MCRCKRTNKIFGITDRKMNQLKIKINRDSVCMADDIDEHKKTYQMDNDATYKDLFYMLKKDNFFPNVYGNNVVWVLTTEYCECVFSYFTKTNKLSRELCEKHLKNICSPSYEMHFKYYSSPGKWKEKILKMYDGDDYTMWREGWLDELKYCDSLTDLDTRH